MIGKIVKGTSFSGCVNYVLKEDKSRLLKAVGVYGSPEEIAEQFELQTLLNDKVKNKVGHISLSFSAEDGDRIRDDDGLMLKIAHDYMKLMGIENTQFIIARHTDRDHPHCHIVYNRVDNDGRTISDKNDRYRNEKVCKMLTARYRLHFAEGKEHVNFMRLRHHDRVKYFIYHALRREVPNARSWSELRLALWRYGIDTQWKLSRTTGEMQGVKFTCNQLTFSGSKIDRQFSFLNIDQELRYNALSATMNLRQVQAETIREEPRHEYQQENHSGISLGLFTPSPTDYDTEEAIQANRLKKKKKKPKSVYNQIFINHQNSNYYELFRFYLRFQSLFVREIRLQKLLFRYAQRQRYLYFCPCRRNGFIHPFLGIQLWCWSLSRLEHYYCAQQLQTEPAGKPEGPCPILQGVRPTLWLQIPLHRR